MKTLGKIFICILVVVIAVGVGYSAYNSKKTNGDVINDSTNTSKNDNNVKENNVDENKNYIGKEENKEEEPLEENKEPEQNEETVEQPKQEEKELTGEEKAVDIVKKQYALEGQTVKYDHMEGQNYVIKINAGTAVTWYLVDGNTWEAEEY